MRKACGLHRSTQVCSIDTWNPEQSEINCCFLMRVKNPYMTSDCLGKPPFISGSLGCSIVNHISYIAYQNHTTSTNSKNRYNLVRFLIKTTPTRFHRYQRYLLKLRERNACSPFLSDPNMEPWQRARSAKSSGRRAMGCPGATLNSWSHGNGYTGWW